MITKVFEEVNLVNFVDIGPTITPDFGTSKFVNPVIIAGGNFNRTLTGSVNSDGTDNSAYGSFASSTDSPSYTRRADLNPTDIADIPIDAVIHKVRLSFDWDLSYDLASNVGGDTNVCRLIMTLLRINTGGLIQSNYGSLTPANANSDCTVSGDTLSDGNTGHVETEIDFDPDGISRQDFLDILNPINAWYDFILQATAESCFVGLGAPKTTSVSFAMEMSNWRMEVDYEESGPGPDIEITGGPSLEIEGTIYDAVVGGPILNLEIQGDVGSNVVISGPTLGLAGGGLVGWNDFIGGPNLEFNGTARKVLTVDVSGLYTFIPGKRNDTLYTGTVEPGDTIDVKIPRPFVKSAFFGG